MIEQRTLEWHRERQGCFTASEIGNLMVSGRKKDEMFGETAKSYITTVVADRLVSPDIVDDDYEYALYLEENHPTTRAMQWGTDHEDDARNRYADNTGFKVELAPSIKHSEIEYFSCSPDGMVGTDGLVEIKCQQPKNFTESAYAILTGGDLKDINRMYYWQVQAQMCMVRLRALPPEAAALLRVHENRAQRRGHRRPHGAREGRRGNRRGTDESTES